MRILFCNFHESHGGGQDTYLLSLIQAFQLQHSVALASPPSSRLYLELKTQISCFAINYKDIFRKWITLLKKLWAFKQWIEDQRFDIIHVNGSADHRAVLLVYIFLKKRPKLVLTKHNAIRIKYGALFRMRYFTDAVIAVSQSTEKHLLQAGIHKSQIHTIPNGIDTNFFRPISLKQKQTLRQQHHLDTNDFILVSNAGTAECKNWPSLIAAIAALPLELKTQIKVIIAGKLPSEDVQIKNVKKFGLTHQVFFTGVLSDTRSKMTLGDVGFVLSNRQETISFACREMMAMGLPVIVSNYGGLPENITPDVDGWIVPANDISALKECLKKILQKKNLTQMGQHAREKAMKSFDKVMFIQDTFKLYQDILSSTNVLK